jgi:hypothetical protein
MKKIADQANLGTYDFDVSDLYKDTSNRYGLVDLETPAEAYGASYLDTRGNSRELKKILKASGAKKVDRNTFLGGDASAEAVRQYMSSKYDLSDAQKKAFKKDMQNRKIFPKLVSVSEKKDVDRAKKDDRIRFAEINKDNLSGFKRNLAAMDVTAKRIGKKMSQGYYENKIQSYKKKLRDVPDSVQYANWDYALRNAIDNSDSFKFSVR